MTKSLISIKNNPTTFYLLLASIVFCACFYIYCVNSAVRNVVTRKQAEDKISILKTTVSELEYKYMSLESQMTIERARILGLVEPSSKVFISKDSGANTESKPISFNKTP